jgi:hypothetical protein
MRRWSLMPRRPRGIARESGLDRVLIDDLDRVAHAVAVADGWLPNDLALWAVRVIESAHALRLDLHSGGPTDADHHGRSVLVRVVATDLPSVLAAGSRGHLEGVARLIDRPASYQALLVRLAEADQHLRHARQEIHRHRLFNQGESLRERYVDEWASLVAS